MEKIHYSKENFIKVECEFEIEDIKNVFLKGQDSFNRTVYFGMWQNQNGDGITANVEDRKIMFDYSRYGLTGSTVNAKKFLQANKKVEKISKEVFFNKLDSIKKILVI